MRGSLRLEVREECSNGVGISPQTARTCMRPARDCFIRTTGLTRPLSSPGAFIPNLFSTRDYRPDHSRRAEPMMFPR